MIEKAADNTQYKKLAISVSGNLKGQYKPTVIIHAKIMIFNVLSKTNIIYFLFLPSSVPVLEIPQWSFSISGECEDDY